MNLTYLGLELKRHLRDVTTMFFTVVLPAFFYLIFGAAQSFSNEPIGPAEDPLGNVAMYIMIAMAAYGAVTATASIGGSAALERMQGWSRQLGLTPLRDGQFVLVKVALAMLIASLPVLLVYLLGLLTGAQGAWSAWVLSGLVVLLGSAVFALWGLVFGLAFRSEAAVAAASGTLVILGFLGNLFFPLSGMLLTIAQFTPLFGYVALARHPLTQGWTLDGTEGGLVHIPLWVPATNVVVWTTILTLLAVLLVRRGRARQ